jgi:hypothetical protein
MSDPNAADGHSIDATKIAAALSAFLDLPRVIRDLEAFVARHRSRKSRGGKKRRT